MAIFKPFKGIRPGAKIVDKLASPPYDVVDRDEAKKFAEGNPYCFFHITRSEIDLPDSIDEHDDSVYKKAKENLDDFFRKGWLFQDKKDYYYIYSQEWRGHIQTGIVGVASCEEYEKGIVRKHELTRKDKEEDRTKHILATRLNTGPVFLTYQGVPEIYEEASKWIKTHDYEYNITDENEVTHTIWVVDDENVIKKFRNYFNKVDILFIADGHHRSASAYNVWKKLKSEDKSFNLEKEYNYFLAVSFPSDQLKILPYNRVVKDLNGHNKDSFFKEISKYFDLQKTGEKEPQKLHDICMYIDKEWYTLTFKREYIENDPIKELDVSILQEKVLGPTLGIKDPRTDNRIKFVGGIRGVGELEKLVDSGKFVVAFSMYPTSIDQLIAVAKNNQIMPPKSTWFEPKLRDALVIHSID
ncbi:MAG: DUF1015 family protein [Spirochaetes bacterium]|nr:DUF1015 family protein [Spirochaetota bacterium]